MRHASALRISFLLALAFAPLASAQFHDPTPDELKMTVDPKAPGAAAIYLDREETTDDGLHFHSYYERIKVLTEKGKELATVHVPYEHGSFKVHGIVGRTIHSDGSIVPLTAKPTDLVDVKNGNYQRNTMVFTLPSVEVGSILEYKLDLEYADNMVISPAWTIQQPYFVRRAHYSFKAESASSHTITNSRGQMLNQLLWAATGLPLSVVKVDVRGLYTIDLTDIPPTPDEDWMPPLNRVNQKVEFYYSYANSGTEFWTHEGKEWAKETQRFINPKSEIKTAVQSIVAPSDTEEQKARKIYAAVMKLDNTDFSRKKSEAERKAENIKDIKNAEDVWKQKSGTGDELALLYVSMARAAGLKAWPMKVANRDRTVFDASYLSTSQLDDYIVAVEMGGKDVFLDPGQRMCPFGLVHWKHALTAGLRLAEKGAVLAQTPPSTYKDAAINRAADLDILPDGSLKGSLHISMNGPEALRWRQMSLENDPDEVKKRYNESIRADLPDGVQAELDHFDALDQYDSSLTAIVKVTGNMGTATGKRLFLPGLFFESRGSHPFVAQEKRTTPVDVHYAKMTSDLVTYRLPAGFSVESAPQATDVSWESNAVLKIRAGSRNSTLQVGRTLAYNFSYLEPKDYADLRGFYQKVAAGDQQQIVLTRAAEAKGN